MSHKVEDPEFPHSLCISLPLPSHRIAKTIQQALSVDPELSPLVQRDFEVPPGNDGEEGSMLVVRYKATTARMLRVSTNGVFESLTTVLRVCEELDIDALEAEIEN